MFPSDKQHQASQKKESNGVRQSLGGGTEHLPEEALVSFFDQIKALRKILSSSSWLDPS